MQHTREKGILLIMSVIMTQPRESLFLISIAS